MREIKFRAWDRRTNEMYYPKALVTETLKYDNSTMAVADLDYGYEIQETINDPLMEYTGLVDKNGTEIYEGDIVSLVEDTNFFIVEWNTAHACFTLKEISILTYYRNFNNIVDKFNLEIVGNIYENSDLLKK